MQSVFLGFFFCFFFIAFRFHVQVRGGSLSKTFTRLHLLEEHSTTNGLEVCTTHADSSNLGKNLGACDSLKGQQQEGWKGQPLAFGVLLQFRDHHAKAHVTLPVRGNEPHTHQTIQENTHTPVLKGQSVISCYSWNMQTVVFRIRFSFQPEWSHAEKVFIYLRQWAGLRKFPATDLEAVRVWSANIFGKPSKICQYEHRVKLLSWQNYHYESHKYMQIYANSVTYANSHNGHNLSGRERSYTTFWSYFCHQRALTITTCRFKMQTSDAAPFQDVNQMCMLEQLRVLQVVLCVYFCHYSYISELKVFSWYPWFRT